MDIKITPLAHRGDHERSLGQAKELVSTEILGEHVPKGQGGARESRQPEYARSIYYQLNASPRR